MSAPLTPSAPTEPLPSNVTVGSAGSAGFGVAVRTVVAQPAFVVSAGRSARPAAVVQAPAALATAGSRGTATTTASTAIRRASDTPHVSATPPTR